MLNSFNNNFTATGISSSFSSSNSLFFLFNETLFLDLLDRFFLINFKSFSVSKHLIFQFKVYLPFSNSLLKFRNKVYIVLYFLLFEIITGKSPIVVPIYNISSKKDNINTLHSKRFKKLQMVNSSRIVNHFLFSLSLTEKDLFNSLLLLHLYVSKHTYLNLTVPSRHVKVSINEAKESSIATLNFNSGINLFEFLCNFDEVLNSKLKLKVFFSLKKLLLPIAFKLNISLILAYIMQALNFNIRNALFIKHLNQIPYIY